MAGASGRLDPPALRALADDRALPPLRTLVPPPRGGGRPRVQRRAATARRAGGLHVGVPRHFALLVRVVPELAERVPLGRGDRRPLGLPAPARLARIEAGRRAARRDRRGGVVAIVPGVRAGVAAVHAAAGSRAAGRRRPTPAG